MSEIYPIDGELTITLEGASAGMTANNLTTTEEGFSLDARQGKVLDDKKLDKESVINNMTTITAGYALDARVGRWLDQNKIGYSDIATDLSTTDDAKVLSASQGVAIKESITDVEQAVENAEKSIDALAKSVESFTVYNVGDIYITTNSTSPAELFGGSWEQIKDRFLLAAGTSYTAGSTGGEAEHTLTVKEMPSHWHSVAGNNKDASAPYHGGYINAGSVNTATNAWYAATNYVGQDQPHNNMPPYLTVYMWRRVA